jgi:hypothetical protein
MWMIMVVGMEVNMDGIFEHSKAVIDYAYRLVKEYEDWQKQQDELEEDKTHDTMVSPDWEQVLSPDGDLPGTEPD